MSAVGQIEKKTQQRVVKLFRDALRYDYLGDWTDRDGNANVEPELLRAWLKKQSVDEALITRALYALDKAAGDTSKSLYDRNRAAYDFRRYGMKVKPTRVSLLAFVLDAPGREGPENMMTRSWMLVALIGGLALAATPVAANTIWVHKTDPTCGGRGTSGVTCFMTIQDGVKPAALSRETRSRRRLTR